MQNNTQHSAKKMVDLEKIKIGRASIRWTNDDMPELEGDIP